MSKQFLAVIAAIIIVFIGIFALSSHKAGSGSGNNAKLTNHVEGLGHDKITLVEYGDYQCPYCGQYYSTLKQVQSEFDQQMTFQFRNLPLVSLHQNAFAGARAAEAAALQNKFWQMHDLLYEQNQIYYGTNAKAATWINTSDPLSFFDKMARQLGLNQTKFDQDYASNTVNDAINADLGEAKRVGADATPTFFLDGKKIQVNNVPSAFAQYINAEIAKKTPGK